MNDWQPIETAPKDGTIILGYEDLGFSDLHSDETDFAIYEMRWRERRRMFESEWKLITFRWSDESDEADPSHWMPRSKRPPNRAISIRSRND